MQAPDGEGLPHDIDQERRRFWGAADVKEPNRAL